MGMEIQGSPALSQSGTPSPPPPTRTWRAASLMRQVVVTLIVGLILAFALQLTLQNYVVEGDSMLPNVHSGDRVLVDRIAYRVSSPQRGDIVVFRFPQPWNRMNLIKRVIGLPGDTVAVAPGAVLVNGHPIHEPYIHFVEDYSYQTQRVPRDEYFVLGDNRQVSYDSHNWGFLPAQDLYGRVTITYWPLHDFHLFGL